jgi:3-deoxy-D-manno-octulosonate 8-phosphate phosphatase (KDO 8-P phosphatase)
MLRHVGIKIGWVSKRLSLATTRRAEELKIDFLEQSKGSKVEIVENLLLKTKLAWEQVSYMGDDIVDLGVLRRAGFAATVADATDEAKAVSHYITRADGGHGGVREVIDLLLKAQGHWEKLVAAESA